MTKTATLPQFSDFVWDQLPVRREVMGDEMVRDIVLAVVQSWPVTEMCQCDAGSDEEFSLAALVLDDVTRILGFVYGEGRFEGYTRLGFSNVVFEVIGVTSVWWRQSKRNRANMNIWRRKWMGEDAE